MNGMCVCVRACMRVFAWVCSKEQAGVCVRDSEREEVEEWKSRKRGNLGNEEE